MFYAVNDYVLPFSHESSFQVRDSSCTNFGERVSKALSPQNFGEQICLLFISAGRTDDCHCSKMVLRQLSYRRICRRNYLDNVADCHVGYFCPPVSARNGHSPEAGRGIDIQFGRRKQIFTIALHGPLPKASCDIPSDCNRLGIIVDYVCYRSDRWRRNNASIAYNKRYAH
ncbi:hypothetical protein B932_3223 [Gluconobacter oxydans H24]|nr:hypothetical protein B932_3223 [Gluconobacter oxydans H24]